MNAFRDAFNRELMFLRSSFWDRAMLTWIPFVLLAVMALQLSSGVMRDLPIVILDQDGTHISRELTAKFEVSPGLRVISHVLDMQEAETIVISRGAYAIVFIPEGAASGIRRGETSQILVMYNASYSTASGSVLREINAVIQAYAGEISREYTSAIAGGDSVRAAPVSVQTTLLFNPQSSYEFQLVSLLHPALLHLIFMVAVTSAFGRELRDGTIGAWLSELKNPVSAVAGKLLPYLIVFMVWAVLATAYLVMLRGWPILGNYWFLLLAYMVMYLAYASVALLLVGVTGSMVQSLSITGLYAGASFAFAGAVFPIEAASQFAQIWSALLPYTWFARVLTEQWMMGSSVSVSLPSIGILCLFLLPGLVIGLPLYIRSASRPGVWGRR